MRRILVTGGTGVVGAALSEQLLCEPQTQLMLLVRARSGPELEEKRAVLARYWRDGPLAAGGIDFDARVRIVHGDVAVPRFGLTESAWGGLTQRVTHIVHAAGEVRMNLPIEAARRSALEGMRNVLALAHAARALRKLEVVSTVGVGGRLGGMLPERWIETPRAFHNTYEQAKAEAEDLLRETAGRMPLTVHRPSMVVGEAGSGRVLRFQVFYHLAEFLSGRPTFGLFPPFAQARLDLVPVDYVARAIAWSLRATETSAGRVLHLAAGPVGSLALGALAQLVQARFTEAGLPPPQRKTVPAPLFRALLAIAARFAGTRRRRRIATLPVFLDYLAADQHFDNTRTRALLAGIGVSLPPMDAALGPILDRYLAARRRP